MVWPLFFFFFFSTAPTPASVDVMADGLDAYIQRLAPNVRRLRPLR